MNLKWQKQFSKGWRKIRLSDGQFTKLIQFSECIRLEKPLPEESRDHALNGEYQDCREFHLGGDALVIYMFLKKEVVF